MSSPDPLIRTKLRLPFTRSGLVLRPRLQEQIAQGLRGPLTLVTAPAGFGKTTLVASYVLGCAMQREPSVRVAWLSLDANDNQAGRFLTYLVAALQTLDPGIGGEAAQLLAQIQQPLPDAVLTSLINDLDSAGTEMALVLDDYHLMTSKAAHAAVGFLIEHCPKNFHLVIATRSDPPLPLARLRARGQMVELRLADLRFTTLEAAQFLNEGMGLHLDASSVAVLEDRTEGWVAGLQMAALALQGMTTRDRKDVPGFIEGFSGTNRYILDYLLEEVLANQPPEIQRFLLYSSILERLSAPLCDALLAEDENPVSTGADSGAPSPGRSASILQYLERENLFLVSLEDVAGAAGGTGLAWYRYHHLFSDLLRIRLQQGQPDLVPLLRIRAADWLEQNGFITEAIQHLFAVEAIGRAAELIERYGPVRWAESDPSVVQMAENLPPEMLIARPKIGLYLAWLLINQGIIEKASPLLNDLARQLAGTDPQSGQRWIETVVTLALAFLGRRSSGPWADPLPDYHGLEEIPAGEVVMRDAADILYGMALSRRGEIDRAIEVSVRCIQREKESYKAPFHGRLVLPSMVPFLAVLYLTQGRLHAAASLCREYLDPIQEKGTRFFSTAGSMNVVLGEVLYEWNRLDEAEQQIREGLRANEPWQNIMPDSLGLLSLARILQAKGDYAGAMQVVEKFEARLQSPTRPIEFAEDFRTLRVHVQLASGDLQSAIAWADQLPHSEDFRLHEEFYRFTLAYVCLAQGKYADVEENLAGVSFPAWVGNHLARRIETSLLLASAAAGQNRLSKAFEMLDTCLSLAEPEGYIRIFLNVGEPARDLLSAYVRSVESVHKPFALKLLEAFPPSGKTLSPSIQQAGLVEPLSERELEVLHLMALGRTNQEIARQLIVAPGTIKAHAASIYRKLDVANRTEAVARARQLSILS